MGKMSNADRARQFLPFDAQAGLREALKIKEYEHERTEKGDISEDLMNKISDNMMNITDENIVKIKYFYDGYYKYENGRCHIDYDNMRIIINDIKIDFDSIFDLEILK